MESFRQKILGRSKELQSEAKLCDILNKEIGSRTMRLRLEFNKIRNDFLHLEGGIALNGKRSFCI